MKLTVSAYQGFPSDGGLNKSINTISQIASEAEENQVDILCFPECYLQGYLLDPLEARRVSLSLKSKIFTTLLSSFRNNRTVIILGMIEEDCGKIYNTAVVIKHGKLVGRYRKHYLHNKESSTFSPGKSFPIFEYKSIKFGINICYDSQFAESSISLTQQGANLIICPLNNSMPHAKAKEWKDKHIKILADKANANNCWVLSSDVVEKTSTNTSYGCTSLISPKGKVVHYLEHSMPGMLIGHVEIKQAQD